MPVQFQRLPDLWVLQGDGLHEDNQGQLWRCSARWARDSLCRIVAEGHPRGKRDRADLRQQGGEPEAKGCDHEDLLRKSEGERFLRVIWNDPQVLPRTSIRRGQTLSRR